MKNIPRKKTFTDQAFEALRQSNLVGNLVPGGLYSTSELAERLGVSRTPVREALLELARRGLVELETNRGFRIKSSSITTLVDVFQLRLMIEGPLCRRATELKTPDSAAEVERAYQYFRQIAEQNDAEEVLRADRDLHKALMVGAGNEKAVEVIQNLRDFVLTTGMGTVPASRTPLEAFDDHRDIVQAYRDGFSDDVEFAVSRHIANTARILIQQETEDTSIVEPANLPEVIAWFETLRK